MVIFFLNGLTLSYNNLNLKLGEVMWILKQYFEMN